MQRSKADGYRSRAAYKLIEINDRYKILKKGQRIIDLGAAPGGWSQIAASIVGAREGIPLLWVGGLPCRQVSLARRLAGGQGQQADAAEQPDRKMRTHVRINSI